ncbi:MAG: M1 family aminopeptidase [Candidatus Njordarchaeales archaeon]
MHIVKHGRDFAFPDYKPNYPRSPDYKLEHVKAEIKVYVFEKRIEGKAALRLKSLKNGLSTIELDAVDMSIRSVKMNNEVIDYDYDGYTIRVILPKKLSRGDTVEIIIDYEARPKKGLYFVLPDKYYPNRVPQVWSQGESEDNRYWIPLYDYPNMKCTSELIIIAPKEFTVVSNGKLLSVEEEGDWKRWHWLMDKPHSTYLIAVAIGLFDYEEEIVDGIPLQYYVPKGRKDDIKRSFARTPDIIRFFSEYLGVPYPWDKYAQVCVSEFVAGGMENTTITILTDRTLHDEKAHMDFESEPLVAHEAAHQWFGDLVTTKDWANIWINESFATYLEAVYRRHWKGNDEFIYRLIEGLDAYLREYNTRYARPIVTRLFKYPSEVFDRHSYPKGALVLHTLNNLVGEETFRIILKRFLEKYKFSNADTEDFRKVIEEVTGKNFEWFFDQYVYNAGHPELAINYKYDPELKQLKISVRQVQKEDSWDEYKLPLEIRVITKNVSRKYKFWIERKEQVFYIPLDEKPERVCFDPEFKVFAVLKIDQGPEQWIRQLKCEHVYCRVLAARALAKFRSSKVVEELKNAVMHDKFWGVSYEAALSLGKIGIEEALLALLECLKTVKHPRIRRGIVRALGNFRDERAAKALSEVLENSEESYYVRAEAAESLGKTKWQKAYDYLVKHIDTPSHNDVITIGVIRGLAELGTEEAFKVIKEYTKLGKPTFVRIAAIIAMAKFPEKREAIDIILEASKDENSRIRGAAIAAAAELMSPKLLPMLDKIASEDLSDGLRRRAREVATKIRRALEKGVEYKLLREEIEKIKEENRRLLDRLARLETKL